MTTYPPPELLYAKTTDYHWPNFEKKMSDREGKYDDKVDGLSDGPFGFGKSVKLKAGIEKVPDEVNQLNFKKYFQFSHILNFSIFVEHGQGRTN